MGLWDKGEVGTQSVLAGKDIFKSRRLGVGGSELESEFADEKERLVVNEDVETVESEGREEEVEFAERVFFNEEA